MESFQTRHAQLCARFPYINVAQNAHGADVCDVDPRASYVLSSSVRRLMQARTLRSLPAHLRPVQNGVLALGPHHFTGWQDVPPDAFVQFVPMASIEDELLKGLPREVTVGTLATRRFVDVAVMPSVLFAAFPERLRRFTLAIVTDGSAMGALNGPSIGVHDVADATRWLQGQGREVHPIS